MSDVSRILTAIDNGDLGAAERLLPLVYDELRMLAAQKLARESPGQTLQPTALVHEVYLRFVGDEQRGSRPHWQSRGHFIGAAAEAMRRILVERARHKGSLKAGGGKRRNSSSRRGSHSAQTSASGFPDRTSAALHAPPHVPRPHLQRGVGRDAIQPITHGPTPAQLGCFAQQHQEGCLERVVGVISVP